MKFVGLPEGCMKDDFLNKWIDKISEHNYIIKDWFGKEKGSTLQNLDSEIMMVCLDRLTDMNIVVLPVHDSLICAKPHRFIVESVMVEAYKAVLGSGNNLIIEEE
jgi:hypothetical protein